MAYTKTTWVDRVVEYPNRYKDQANTQYTFTLDSGTITAEGTPVNAVNMNNIENELAVLDNISTFETSTGTTNNIILTLPELADGMQKNFIANAGNSGTATTVNNLYNVYKIGTTDAPVIEAEKCYTIVYNLTNDCFYVVNAPSHTHLKSEITDLNTDAFLPRAIEEPTLTDMNNALKVGRYRFSPSTANRPTDYGVVDVKVSTGDTYNGTSGWIFQVAYSSATGYANKVYQRCKIDTGAWSGWSEVVYASSPTFTGTPKTTANTSYTTTQLRNSYFSTTIPSSLANGEICFVYE